jgi:hypothetical protein
MVAPPRWLRSRVLKSRVSKGVRKAAVTRSVQYGLKMASASSAGGDSSRGSPLSVPEKAVTFLLVSSLAVERPHV